MVLVFRGRSASEISTIKGDTAPLSGTIQVVEYTYDMHNRRIGKTVDTSGDGDVDWRERYVWDTVMDGKGNVVLDFVDDGSDAEADVWELKRRYLWGQAVDQLFAQEEFDYYPGYSTPENVLWTLADNLGSIRDLAKYDTATDTTSIESHYTYYAFGTVTSGDVYKTRYLFTAQEYDLHTDTWYYDERYYDSWTAQFLSPDPIQDDPTNDYRPMGNNPVNNTDPTGLEKKVAARYEGDEVWVDVERTDGSRVSMHVGSITNRKWYGSYTIELQGIFENSRPMNLNFDQQMNFLWGSLRHRYGFENQQDDMTDLEIVLATSDFLSRGGVNGLAAERRAAQRAMDRQGYIGAAPGTPEYTEMVNRQRLEEIKQIWANNDTFHAIGILVFAPGGVNPNPLNFDQAMIMMAGKGAKPQVVSRLPAGTARNTFTGSAARYQPTGQAQAAQIAALKRKHKLTPTLARQIGNENVVEYYHRAGLHGSGTIAAQAPTRRPNLPTFIGKKTSGVLRTVGGDTSLISGLAGPAKSMPTGSAGFDIVTRTHVEGHAAAIMRQQGIKDATLYINNPRICPSCQKLLPRMLPPGSKLNVILPDGTSVPFEGNAQ